MLGVIKYKKLIYQPISHGFIFDNFGGTFEVSSIRLRTFMVYTISNIAYSERGVFHLYNDLDSCLNTTKIASAPAHMGPLSTATRSRKSDI